MASVTITMTAPSSLGQGNTVQFRDGSSATVGAYGITAVPALFVDDMLKAGFTIFGTPSVAGGIVADTNANQANAVLLPAEFNRVATTGAANAGVKLPASAPGARVRVTNMGANACGVFPQVNEQIAAGAANALFSVAANKTAEFSCVTAGYWDAVLSA